MLLNLKHLALFVKKSKALSFPGLYHHSSHEFFRRKSVALIARLKSGELSLIQAAVAGEALENGRGVLLYLGATKTLSESLSESAHPSRFEGATLCSDNCLKMVMGRGNSLRNKAGFPISSQAPATNIGSVNSQKSPGRG